MNTNFALGGAFFGRLKTCELFEKRLAAFQKGYRQNIGILAAPLLGKTALLGRFLESAASQPGLIPIFFSCRPSEPFEWFAQRWMGELLLAMHRVREKTLPANPQLLIRSLKPVIPRTIHLMRAAKQSISAHRYDQAYRELMSLTGALQQETGKKILLVLDNFDRMEELEVQHPFDSLGKEIMVQKETMYVVTAARQARGRTILQEKLSLLFGNFEMTELHPFDFDEARAFVEWRLGENRMEEPVKRFLIRLTNGHPYYLDCFVERFLDSAGTDRPHTARLTDILYAELYERDGKLNRYFESCLHSLKNGRGWTRYADVLLAIALGQKKMLVMTRFLHLKVSETKKALEGLLKAELIGKHGSLFVIQDPLFRFWLAQAYWTRRVSFDSLAGLGGEGFRQKSAEAFEQSVREDSLELPKRVEELFRRFANDVVELNQRKFSCPQFTEVCSRPASGRIAPVMARNGKVRWLCQIQAQPVTEEDVRLFLDDLKRLRGPVQKKLIVGLHGIDLNAKLLAQEAKIQYLDSRSLNFLLDVYDREKVVV